jgi:hypothetical protein
VKELVGLLPHYSMFSASLRRQCVHGIFLEKKDRNSMKIKVIFIVALAVCLSSSMAMAITINNGASGESNLWDIVSSMLGVPIGTITQTNLTGLTPLETLSDGSYVVTNLARQASYTQNLGYYTGIGTGSGKTSLVSSVNSSTNYAVNDPFTVNQSFGFYDTTDQAGTKYTEKTLNTSYGSQSNGFIFDLTSLGYSGVYIVAFEDGGGSQPLGDWDYQDCVARVNAVPLPGAVLLLGAGLVRLVAYARRREDD